MAPPVVLKIERALPIRAQGFRRETGASSSTQADSKAKSSQFEKRQSRRQRNWGVWALLDTLLKIWTPCLISHLQNLVHVTACVKICFTVQYPTKKFDVSEDQCLTFFYLTLCSEPSLTNLYLFVSSSDQQNHPNSRKWSVFQLTQQAGNSFNFISYF